MAEPQAEATQTSHTLDSPNECRRKLQTLWSLHYDQLPSAHVHTSVCCKTGSTGSASESQVEERRVRRTVRNEVSERYDEDYDLDHDDWEPEEDRPDMERERPLPRRRRRGGMISDASIRANMEVGQAMADEQLERSARERRQTVAEAQRTWMQRNQNVVFWLFFGLTLFAVAYTGYEYVQGKQDDRQSSRVPYQPNLVVGAVEVDDRFALEETSETVSTAVVQEGQYRYYVDESTKTVHLGALATTRDRAMAYDMRFDGYRVREWEASTTTTTTTTTTNSQSLRALLERVKSNLASIRREAYRVTTPDGQTSIDSAEESIDRALGFLDAQGR